MTENPVEGKTKNSIDANAADAFREGSFEIKTQAEIPVISKTARVIEEVVIGKQTTEHAEIIRDSVKRTAVQIENISTDEAGNRENG